MNQDGNVIQVTILSLGCFLVGKLAIYDPFQIFSFVEPERMFFITNLSGILFVSGIIAILYAYFSTKPTEEKQ